jgi:hypothetical protein
MIGPGSDSRRKTHMSNRLSDMRLFSELRVTIRGTQWNVIDAAVGEIQKDMEVKLKAYCWTCEISPSQKAK